MYNKKLNYCTCSPEGLFGIRYNYACYLHDRQYRHEVKKRQTRFKADLDLWKNIIKESWKISKWSITWSWLVGGIYFIIIRLFGKFTWK